MEKPCMVCEKARIEIEYPRYKGCAITAHLRCTAITKSPANPKIPRVGLLLGRSMGDTKEEAIEDLLHRKNRSLLKPPSKCPLNKKEEEVK